MTERVRLYGYSLGESSFTQVTRGVRRALDSLGEFAGFYPIDNEPDEELPGGMAPLSLNIGSPAGLLRAHRSGAHKRHWFLLAPNSEGLPEGFASALVDPSEILPEGLLTGGLLTPSTWGKGVLERAFPGKTILVAPHGVDRTFFRPNPRELVQSRKDFAHGIFSVLHMTSTEADRKSTKALMRAWKSLKERKAIPQIACLHIVMNPMHVSKVHWWASELGLGPSDYIVAPGLAYNRYSVASLYGSMHVVCQPSRAEGFGLVPLEALATGTPVVATIATGHEEYARGGLPGLVEVAVGPDGPMDDFPGAVAPTVSSEAIATALAWAFERWSMLSVGAEENAAALGEEWSWQAKTGAALREMIESGV